MVEVGRRLDQALDKQQQLDNDIDPDQGRSRRLKVSDNNGDMMTTALNWVTSICDCSVSPNTSR
jgi:hypothetical protein